MAGIGTGQLILLAATPILGRVYGPAAFGHFALVTAISGVLATIGALRLDLALASASDDELANLARAALPLPLLVAPLGTGIVWLIILTPFGLGWGFTPRDLSLVALIASAQGMMVVVIGLGTRLGAFRALALCRIVQPLLFALIALIAIESLELSMALGWVAALIVAMPLLMRVSWRRGWWDAASAAASKWRFVAISAPVALLDVLALALPVMFIAATFGDDAAGHYSQVQRLVGAPLMLVATAAAQVFFKYAGDRHRAGQTVMPLLGRVSGGMALLSIACLLLIMLAGQPALTFLLGPPWRVDTWFLVLVLTPVVFRVIASPVSSTLIVLDRLGTIGLWQGAYFLVTFATLWIAREVSFDQMLLAYAASELVMYGAYLLLCIRASGASHPGSRSTKSKSVCAES